MPANPSNFRSHDPLRGREPDADTPLADKVRFLASSGAHAGQPQVRVIETHMSFLFLTGALVLKFKKPVRYPFLDFTTLSRRRRYCEAELKLNRRLAPDVYRRLVPLCRDTNGRLTIDGPGEIVEWLVEMRQLSAANMLDTRLTTGSVSRGEIVAVLEKLGRFYAGLRPQRRDGHLYLDHLRIEMQVNRKLLTRPDFDLPRPRTERLIERVEALLVAARPMIEQRIASGHIVEGHGDLRPEHIHLDPPPQIIDCLEFDRSMRILDPYDEVGYLGMECEMRGAEWIGPLALDVLDGFLRARPEPGLMATYGAFRAMLRARICMAHLLDPEPMAPEVWPAEARRYLDIAERECLRAEG